MKRPEIRPLLLAGRSLRAIALGGMLAAGLATMPSAARADCDVPDNGIPEESLLSKLGPAWVSLGGLRPALAKGGIGVSATYYGEAFANSGGFKQGGKYDGVLDVAIDADLHKLGFWKGLCFHTNGFQIHGQSITASNIGSLMPVSSLEATPNTRLFELWLEQHMFGDKLAVKVGQLAADTEFILSEGGGFFLNGTWGWPSITAADLPSGGPAYPLATPGVRVAVTPSDKFQLLVGVYNGDPAPPCGSDDPQVCNSNGLDFELDDPPLLMVEGAYKYNQERLAGTVKLGGWNHFGDFEHQRFSAGGNLIAVTGDPGKPLDNDWGFYGIIDQLIWRLPGSEEAKGVALFGRVIGAPSDRNLDRLLRRWRHYLLRHDPAAGPTTPSPLASPIPAFPIRCTASTSTQGLPWRAITRRCLRSATPCSLPRAGRCSLTSSTSGSPAAMCLTKTAGPWKMRLCLGHVRP